jgi:hypothetical protein
MTYGSCQYLHTLVAYVYQRYHTKDPYDFWFNGQIQELQEEKAWLLHTIFEALTLGKSCNPLLDCVVVRIQDSSLMLIEINLSSHSGNLCLPHCKI